MENITMILNFKKCCW